MKKLEKRYKFVKMLEFAGKIQESSQNGFGGTEMSESYAAAYETVLSVYHITRYRNYYNGNLRFLGLPGGGGEYHVIKPEVNLLVQLPEGRGMGICQNTIDRGASDVMYDASDS